MPQCRAASPSRNPDARRACTFCSSSSGAAADGRQFKNPCKARCHVSFTKNRQLAADAGVLALIPFATPTFMLGGNGHCLQYGLLLGTAHARNRRRCGVNRSSACAWLYLRQLLYRRLLSCFHVQDGRHLPIASEETRGLFLREAQADAHLGRMLDQLLQKRSALLLGPGFNAWAQAGQVWAKAGAKAFNHFRLRGGAGLVQGDRLRRLR